MKKLWKYIKPYWWVVLVIITMTFAQVQFELALPDYMSSIVTNGIQYGGIEDSRLLVMQKDTMDKLLLFMDEGDKKETLDSYTIFNKGTNARIDNQVIEFKEDVYVLNEKVSKDLLDIELKPIVYTSIIEQLDNSEDIFTLIKNGQKDVVLDGIDQKLAGQENSFETLAKMYCLNEYKTVGLAMDVVQNNYILFTGMKMLMVAGMCALAQIVSTYLATRLAAKVANKLRADVFRKVGEFSSSDLNSFSTSSLITRTTNDINQVQMLVQMFCRIVLIAPMMGLVSISKVLRYPDLIWLLVLALMFISLAMIITLILAMPKFSKIQSLVDNLNRVMREFLDGILVIRAFNSQASEEKRFDEASNEYRKTDLFVSRMMAFIMPFMTFIMNIMTVFIVWFGSKQVDMNLMAVGDIMAFIQYAFHVLMSFMIVAMIWVMIPRALVSVKRIFEVLDKEVSIKDCDKPKKMPKRNATIVFDNVSFAYPGADEPVLQNINITIEPNETVAFIGSTGSGKSTLIKLLLRLFDVSSGSITYNGTDIREYSQSELRENIGYVPQKALLFKGTIKSNIEFGKEVDQKTLDRAIDVSQSREIVEENALKLDTEIVQGGTNVSGGQRQRLSIARALAKDANIYIFDDSFSALDYATDKKLRKALETMTSAKKATVLIVAQRIATIRDADKIVVLDEGKIAGIGKHDELLRNCAVYKEIAQSQLSGEELANA